MNRYWVDANVFIWGSNVPYPFEHAQGYWKWFGRKVEEGTIVTHVKVYEEILKGNKSGKEELIIPWMKTRRDSGLRIRCTSESQELVGKICTRALEMYGPIKGKEFLKGADPFLIAQAYLDSGTLVTQESRTKLRRIPALCDEFGVGYMNMFEMNAALNAEYGS